MLAWRACAWLLMHRAEGTAAARFSPRPVRHLVSPSRRWTELLNLRPSFLEQEACSLPPRRWSTPPANWRTATLRQNSVSFCALCAYRTSVVRAANQLITSRKRKAGSPSLNQTRVPSTEDCPDSMNHYHTNRRTGYARRIGGVPLALPGSGVPRGACGTGRGTRAGGARSGRSRHGPNYTV